MCPNLCNPMECSTPGFPVHHQLLELIQTHSIEVVMPSNHLILCHPLLLPSIIPSIRVFSQESVFHIRWPKYWSSSFNISPSNEYSGLISFRMDWLDLLSVWGTLKSILQHNSSKASILRCSAFFIVQLWHPYITTGKNKDLARQTFVGKVISLLFNMLSRLVKKQGESVFYFNIYLSPPFSLHALFMSLLNPLIYIGCRQTFYLIDCLFTVIFFCVWSRL